MFCGNMYIQNVYFVVHILKQLMRETNMSNLCFVTPCTFKMSILWYSETVGNGRKLFRFMFTSKMLI